MEGCTSLVAKDICDLMDLINEILLILGLCQIFRSPLNRFFCLSVHNTLWAKEQIQPSPAWLLVGSGTTDVLPDFELLVEKNQDKVPRKITKPPNPKKLFLDDSQEEKEMIKQRKKQLKQFSREEKKNFNWDLNLERKKNK